MYKYKAFGFIISSDIFLPQVLQSDEKTADIEVRLSSLTENDISSEEAYYSANDIRFSVDNVARFKITNGSLIEVSPLTDDYTKLPVIILGSCMGAILHQRGEFPLHGSCVTDGKQTILITGDSGAGKSTLASIFLKHGWKLLTDDVALIKDPEHTAMVQPSYPSQKLWEDSLLYADKNREDVHTFYQRNGKNKFGVNIKEKFISEAHPLTMIIKLVASNMPTSLEEIKGFAKVDQLMNNTYRSFMIMPENLEKHFQKCVTMGCNIPMFFANRCMSDTNREALYEFITGERKNKVEENMIINENTKLKRKDNIITADMQGSAVTMDVTTGKYYDLGETGGAIWNLLKDEITYADLLDKIMREYEVSREECENDVKSFINKLAKDGLILLTGK